MVEAVCEVDLGEGLERVRLVSWRWGRQSRARLPEQVRGGSSVVSGGSGEVTVGPPPEHWVDPEDAAAGVQGWSPWRSLKVASGRRVRLSVSVGGVSRRVLEGRTKGASQRVDDVSVRLAVEDVVPRLSRFAGLPGVAADMGSGLVPGMSAVWVVEHLFRQAGYSRLPVPWPVSEAGDRWSADGAGFRLSATLAGSVWPEPPAGCEEPDSTDSVGFSWDSALGLRMLSAGEVGYDVGAALTVESGDCPIVRVVVSDRQVGSSQVTVGDPAGTHGVLSVEAWQTVAGVPAVAGNGRAVAWSPDGSLLAVGHSSAPYLTVLDTSDWSVVDGVSALPGEAAGVAFSPDGSMLAVGHFSGDRLTVLDTSNWSVVDGVPVPGGSGRGVAWSQDGAMLAVAHAFGDNLTVIDTSAWSVVEGTPTLPETGNAVVWNGHLLAVAHDGAPYLTVLDATDWSTVDVPALPGEGASVAWSEGGMLAVGHAGAPSLTVLDTSNWSVVDGVSALPARAWSVAWRGPLLAVGYGGGENADNLTVLDATDWSQVSVPAVPWQGRGVAWSQDGAMLAVAHLTGDGLRVLDVLTGTVTAAGQTVTAPIRPGPIAAALAPRPALWHYDDGTIRIDVADAAGSDTTFDGEVHVDADGVGLAGLTVEEGHDLGTLETIPVTEGTPTPVTHDGTAVTHDGTPVTHAVGQETALDWANPPSLSEPDDGTLVYDDLDLPLDAVPPAGGTLWQIVAGMVEAAGGGLWVAPDGRPTVRSAAWMRGERQTPTTVTSREHIGPLRWREEWLQVAHAVEVGWATPTLDGAGPHEVWTGQAEEIPPQRRITVKASWQPAAGPLTVNVAGNTAADGSGSQVPVHASLLRVGSSEALVTLWHDETAPVWTVDTGGDPDLAIDADWIIEISDRPVERRRVNAASTGVVEVAGGGWRQDRQAASLLADRLSAELSRARAWIPDLPVHPAVDVDLGSPLTVQDPDLSGIGETAVVEGLTLGGRAGEVTQTVAVRRALPEGIDAPEQVALPDPVAEVSGGSVLAVCRALAGQVGSATDVPVTIDGEPLGRADVAVSVEDAEGDRVWTVDRSGLWLSQIADSRSAWVILDGDLVVPEGTVWRPPARKLFWVVYVSGDASIDGVLSMTARGADHSPTGSDIAPAAILVASGTFSGVVDPAIPENGGAGAAAQRTNGSNVAGASGSAGTGGGSGGGGSGAAARGTGGRAISGAGAAGTAFSGGPGGGGARANFSSRSARGQAGAARGGQGGAGHKSGGVGSPETDGSGGAGNPGGPPDGAGRGQPGDDGTGGTLILIVEGALSGAGQVVSEGSPGGGGSRAQPGGASGGGAVTVLSGSGSVAVSTAGGQSPGAGGDGGAGDGRTLTIP